MTAKKETINKGERAVKAGRKLGRREIQARGYVVVASDKKIRERTSTSG